MKLKKKTNSKRPDVVRKCYVREKKKIPPAWFRFIFLTDRFVLKNFMTANDVKLERIHEETKFNFCQFRKWNVNAPNILWLPTDTGGMEKWPKNKPRQADKLDPFEIRRLGYFPSICWVNISTSLRCFNPTTMNGWNLIWQSNEPHIRHQWRLWNWLCVGRCVSYNYEIGPDAWGNM